MFDFKHHTMINTCLVFRETFGKQNFRWEVEFFCSFYFVFSNFLSYENKYRISALVPAVFWRFIS